MGFFGDLKRRVLIFQAFQFGREFYGLDLEPMLKQLMRPMIEQVKCFDDPIPQVIFYMLVPAYLSALGYAKRLELLDGLIQMRLAHAVPEEIYENFMIEYEAADRYENQN